MTVVDTAGAPITNASVVATLQRTGEVLNPTGLMMLTAGTHVIVDDGARDRLRPQGDSVHVTGRVDAGPVTTAMYFITVPGGCHVTKASGPDTLVVRPP